MSAVFNRWHAISRLTKQFHLLSIYTKITSGAFNKDILICLAQFFLSHVSFSVLFLCTFLYMFYIMPGLFNQQ